MQIAEPILNAIDQFSKLPGIGRKTAQRLSLFILKNDKEFAEKLADSILTLKTKLRQCERCFNISEDELCPICSNNKRDHSTICIVEDISDLLSIEKSNEYNGIYHVLGGVLSPLSGISADNLTIKQLISRFSNENIKEVILALNPDVEGETTSLYLAKLLKPFDVRITRIARGIPIGGDLEFTDEITIGRALLNRTDL